MSGKENLAGRGCRVACDHFLQVSSTYPKFPDLATALDYARRTCDAEAATIEIWVDGLYICMHQPKGWPPSTCAPTRNLVGHPKGKEGTSSDRHSYEMLSGDRDAENGADGPFRRMHITSRYSKPRATAPGFVFF